MRASDVDGGVALLDAAQEAVTQRKKLFGLFGGPKFNFESLTPNDLPGTPSSPKSLAKTRPMPKPPWRR